MTEIDTLARIKQLRDNRGWSNYRLSKETGVSPTTLRNMFNRNTDPSISTLEAICKGFGITLSQFFSEGGEPVELDTGQREMLNTWNALCHEQKAALLALLKK